jgi:pimeloyl-ACP methyl ester carboxylesterase
MELTEQFEWQGRTIACGRAGTSPDVVFCHGTPFSSAVWTRYADALSDDFTVHLWDMPGYVQSSKDRDHAVDFDAHAKAFKAHLHRSARCRSPDAVRRTRRPRQSDPGMADLLGDATLIGN